MTLGDHVLTRDFPYYETAENGFAEELERREVARIARIDYPLPGLAEQLHDEDWPANGKL